MSWIKSLGRRGALVSVSVLPLAACQATTGPSGRTVYTTPTLGQVLGLRPPPAGASVIPAQTSGAVTERRVVNRRTVEIITVRGGQQITVDSRVLATDQISSRVVIQGVYVGGGRAYALVEENSGGTACPAQYQAIDLTGAIPVISPQFGSCSDIPRVSVSNGTLVVTDPGLGAARPGKFTFRDGRLSRSSL